MKQVALALFALQALRKLRLHLTPIILTLTQVALTLFAPQALRKLRLPRLRAAGIDLPVGDANLWLGGAKEGKPIRTDLHKDARPNLLHMLQGRKRVLVLPPRDEARLQPATLLDVQSVQAEVSHDGTPALRLDEGLWAQDVDRLLNPIPDPKGLWPRDVDRLLFDHQHYAATLESVRSMLRPSKYFTTELHAPTASAQQQDPSLHASPAPAEEHASGTQSSTRSHDRGALHTASVCSFDVEAPDALFIPPGFAHAVETLASGAPDDLGAAINIFYDVPEAVCRSLGGAGKRWLMGRHVQCGSS